MKDFALVLAILGLWIVLNRWVLPAMGVPTCMSGACSIPVSPAAAPAEPGSDKHVTGLDDRKKPGGVGEEAQRSDSVQP